MTPKTPASLLLAAVVAVAILLLAIPVRADSPVVVENQDASRTVSWTFSTVANLTLQDVVLAGDRLMLPWRNEDLAWTSSADFGANGTADSNATAGSSGLELAVNSASYLESGDFASDSGWAFADGPAGEVTAEWDAAAEVAVLGHDSPTTQSPWDSLDQIALDWNWNAPVGTLGGIVQNTSGQREGTGRLGMNLDTTGGGTWGSALHGGTVDWSAADRLVIWVEAVDVVPPVSFNITAFAGSNFRTTPAISLIAGWQELSFDLAPLGTLTERSSLSEVRFRVNAVNAPSAWVYFDDARVGTIKQFDEAAFLTQLVPKTNETTPRPGSAYLSFDWALVNATGIVDTEAVVNLTGPSGFFEAPFGSDSPSVWETFTADVSATTALPGGYVFFVRFRVVADNSSESHANLRVDNASLVFPDRQNGTYASYPISLGRVSEFLNVSWSATLPVQTRASVSLRSGNGTDTNDPSWSPWETFGSPGKFPLAIRGGDHFQLRIELNTTNASRTPVLQSVSLETRHRVSSGVVSSDAFAARTDFLRWRSFAGNWSGPSAANVAFSIGNGTFWTPVPPSGNIVGFQGPVLLWRAVLSTTNGLATPALFRIDAIYEFTGPAHHVRITTSDPLDVDQGGIVRFDATVEDAGDHPLKLPVVWSTDDPTGHVYNNGTYVAGSVGTWNVTATAVGLGFSSSMQVTVAEAPVLPIQAELLTYSLAIVVALAGVFAAYEVAIRRMFAIDDVFLISRDGRLIMHNTRRMRADRDEDILTGMLTAILSFVRDADPEEDGDLRRFELGGKTTLLERGQNVFVSAVYSGRVPRWAAKDLRRFVADLETRFGEAFAKWTGAREDLPDLKEATHRFVSRVRYRSARKESGRSR